MKVFLSHSTKDDAFVEKLAAAITGAGFEPWLCEVDVDKNENFVTKIEEGLGGAMSRSRLVTRTLPLQMDRTKNGPLCSPDR